MNIHAFIVPYDSGKRAERMGAGPLHIIDNGLEQYLKERGHSVRKSIIEAQDPFRVEIKTSYELYRQLAISIQENGIQGEFPLILSGNCSASLGGIGGVSGLISNPLGIAWLDAHGDFNTPDTTLSGFLDGMGLAVAAGLCWRNLAKTLPGFRPVSPVNIVHIGGRDFDPEEEQLLIDQAVTLIRAREVRENGVRVSLGPALDKLGNQIRELYLHLDVDVLDPEDTPANHFPAPGGLFVKQAVEVITMIRDQYQVRGMTVASYDPAYDREGNTLRAIFELVHQVLS